jgi:hypothetical protein
MKPNAPNTTVDGQLACAFGEPWMGPHPICAAETARICGVPVSYVSVPNFSHSLPPERTATMFPPDTAMMLKKVTFTTEVVDEETRRVVVCTFGLAPFTGPHAVALNVKSVLFDGNGQPKPALDAAELKIEIPLQRLSWKMAPDQSDASLVLAEVAIDPKLRIKIKRDRDPVDCQARLQVSFRYPTADDLLYIANGVNGTHYLTFEPEQAVMDFAAASESTTPEPARHIGRRNKKPVETPPVEAGDEIRPGVHAEH